MRPQRGSALNLGSVAGTGSRVGIPGIGAADLGEVVQLPDGRYVAIFGDAFGGDHVGAELHYASVAVPVAFDANDRPSFGAPLTGPTNSPNVLFPTPPPARGSNTLPAGSIRMRDGTTFVMVTGTTSLRPDGGSWLVLVTNDPGSGWPPVRGSWRPWTPGEHGTSPLSHPTQISGCQAADGFVYIAADSFDRSQPVTMYRVAAGRVADRGVWRPWTGAGWGAPGKVATVPIGRDRFGELSFREIDGRPVLAGFNASNGPGAVEVHVGCGSPPEVLAPNASRTIVVQQHDPDLPNFVPQNYGGYLVPLPDSTLDKLNLFVSQWHTPHDGQGRPIGPQIYNTQHIVVNANRDRPTLTS